MKKKLKKLKEFMIQINIIIKIIKYNSINLNQNQNLNNKLFLFQKTFHKINLKN